MHVTRFDAVHFVSSWNSFAKFLVDVPDVAHEKLSEYSCTTCFKP